MIDGGYRRRKRCALMSTRPSIVQPLAHCEFFSFWTRSGRWWNWPARDMVTLAAVQLPLTRSGANVAYWHIATNLTAAWHVRNRGTTGPSPEAQSTRMTRFGSRASDFAVTHNTGFLL